MQGPSMALTNGLAVGSLSSGSAKVVRRFATPERHLAFWVLLWVVVLAAEFGVLVPVIFHGDEDVQAIDVVFRLVGGSFAACGLIAWHRRPDNHSGRLMTATGIGFWLGPLLGQLDWPIAETVALMLPDLWLLFFVPLLLTFLTGGRLRTTTDRVLVICILVELLVLGPLWLVFSDQPGNLLLVSANPDLAKIVDSAQRGVFLSVSLVTAVVLAVRWKAASRPGRRAMLPVLAGATCLLLMVALLTVDLVAGSRSVALLWIAICSLVTVPAAFLAGLLRSRLARGALADLFRRLRTMRPVELQTALARALGDPELVIAYPLATGGYVDIDGRPVSLPTTGGRRSVATVERGGTPVAALVYDTSLDDDPELVEAVGSAATIALENRHLQEEAEARLREVRASRDRIIAAGDAERRRIERNLHDGAQQRLVTVALQLSMIQRQIRENPSDAEELVSSASAELAESLSDLRELARGVHPAALDQSLEHALETLALRAPIPVSVIYEISDRLPRPIEFAAYFVASEALANIGKYAQATTAAIRVSRYHDLAAIEIADDGVGGADPARGSGLRGLADRVEALDGQLTVRSPAGHGTVVRAEIPCAAAV